MNKREYYLKNRQRILDRESFKRKLLKQKFLSLYGSFCHKCGETESEFLSLDHVNSDGAAHRKILSSDISIIKEAVNFIDHSRFRVLCYNCNGYESVFNRTKPYNQLTYQGKLYRRQRQLVLRTYGNMCVCCGQDNPVYLQIDHLNGGGCRHVKNLGGGASHLIKEILNKNFPSEYQLLCANCNHSKYVGKGFCIHDRKRASHG